MKLVSEQNKALEEQEQSDVKERGNTAKPTYSLAPSEDLISTKLSLSNLLGPLWL